MFAVIIIFVVIVIAFVLPFFFVPSKGNRGETQVARLLSKLPNEEYKIINNLLINLNGKTTQIDHIVVSEYRVFVIETKFYQGRIYGGPNWEFWTQNIHGKKYKLWNPIYQNQGHIRALSHLLPDIHPDLFVSIVAFSRQASVNCINNKSVVYWNQINEVIQSYQHKCISLEQTETAYNKLLAANIDSKENRKQHVKNIKEQITKHKIAIANNRCPRCGSKLVLRDGKYGRFYGCQNYPNCRYTHQA